MTHKICTGKSKPEGKKGTQNRLKNSKTDNSSVVGRSKERRKIGQGNAAFFTGKPFYQDGGERKIEKKDEKKKRET